MALNFPANTSLPYVDPVSGLKYIYNTSIGAWEAAVQPPAIISSAPPALTIPGFLWWDDENGNLYIYYKDEDSEQWVDATTGGGGGGGGGGSRASVGPNPPVNAFQGDLWWNNVDGRLYIYYEDRDSEQWIQAQPQVGGGIVNFSDIIDFFSSNDEPDASASQRGDLWYNESDSTLYVRVGTPLQWKKVHNITDPKTFVTRVIGGSGVKIGGTAKLPRISVTHSSTSDRGIVRLSTSSEAQEASDKTTALSPGVLKDALAASPTSYLPNASESTEGVAALASAAEVTAGTEASKVVTPATLKSALPSLGASVPVGTIITFAGATAPTGYLACDGAVVSRTTYQALFQVVGTVYGIGDGVTTFKLPTVSGDFLSCIKF